MRLDLNDVPKFTQKIKIEQKMTQCKAILKRYYNKRRCRLEAVLSGYCIMHLPKSKEKKNNETAKQHL